MARTISIGAQGYEDLRTNGYFYVDKTGFVRDWWMAADSVTLVCRPRRFGKTLNLDTVRCFFSTEFAGRGEELFGGLAVWDDPSMRTLQGTVPVVSLSFARVKQGSFHDMLRRICELVRRELDAHGYLRSWDGLTDGDRRAVAAISDDMDAVTCAGALNTLCDLLFRFHGVKPVVLLDEYDAPMQEAWLGGFWDEAAHFMRDLMNSTFKTNTALGRGLITGVTRVSRESIFSDLNNLRVITTSSPIYQTCFGFTQTEVDAALEEFGLGEQREAVRDWYDGFVFDGIGGIYNPWSITNFLDYGVIDLYWANTSGNALASSIVRTGGKDLKQDFEALLKGGSVEKVIDEQVVFSELGSRPDAVWALLLASGYLRLPDPAPAIPSETPRRLELTNREVRSCFDRMIRGWFDQAAEQYNDFVRALLAGDAEAMEAYLSDVALACMSSFDSGTSPSAYSQPERFWHGLVLGLLVDLRGRYEVASNRESGYGRCDVMLTPLDGPDGRDPAVILEFKVVNERRGEKTLEDAVASACAQIESRDYAASLIERGISPDRIRIWGIAFQGKDVMVG